MGCKHILTRHLLACADAWGHILELSALEGGVLHHMKNGRHFRLRQLQRECSAFSSRMRWVTLRYAGQWHLHYEYRAPDFHHRPEVVEASRASHKMLESPQFFITIKALLYQVEQRGSWQVAARLAPLSMPPGFANLF
jgi:hypothetical protein